MALLTQSSVPVVFLDNALVLQLLDSVSVVFPEFSHLGPELVVLVPHIYSFLSSLIFSSFSSSKVMSDPSNFLGYPHPSASSSVSCFSDPSGVNRF